MFVRIIIDASNKSNYGNFVKTAFIQSGQNSVLHLNNINISNYKYYSREKIVLFFNTF